MLPKWKRIGPGHSGTKMEAQSYRFNMFFAFFQKSKGFTFEHHKKIGPKVEDKIFFLPVVPHKAVAEVSKIGNL